MPAELRDRTHALVWARASQLAELESGAPRPRRFRQAQFAGSTPRGTVGRAAVLDWEFAVSGSRWPNWCHFLRYERNARASVEPHFSGGYLHGGGTLPHEGRRLARLVDLAALCESLTHEQIPDTVVAEWVELVRATVENRCPLLDEV
jgi:hypothetical protein